MLFDKYNLTSDDCIFVTDTVGDILEANKVNLRSIAVTCGFHEKERLEKVNPFVLISDFSKIKGIVDSL